MAKSKAKAGMTRKRKAPGGHKNPKGKTKTSASRGRKITSAINSLLRRTNDIESRVGVLEAKAGQYDESTGRDNAEHEVE